MLKKDHIKEERVADIQRNEGVALERNADDNKQIIH